MTVGRITPGIPAIVHLCGGIAQRRRFWLTAGSSGVRAVDQMDNGATYLQLLVTPGFDLAASVCFTDPFRVSNFLTGRNLFQDDFISSSDDQIRASNGGSVATRDLPA